MDRSHVVRKFNEPSEDRERSQNNQWNGHQASGMMTQMCFFLAEESQKNHSESIDGRNKGSDECGKVEPDVSFFARPRQPQDLIFAVEACRYEWKRSKRCRANEEGPIYDRDFFPKASHFEHVLLMM